MTYLKETTITYKQPLVKLDNIIVKYDNLIALDNINLTIKENDYLYIIGPNGAGKSTLIKLLTNQLKPNSGTIKINTNSIGYLPQTLNQKPNFPITVREVIYTGFTKQQLFINKNDLNLINYWLGKMQIAHLADELMSNLSGGQQQRVFLIRALISNPKLLILDEPTSALDPDFRKQFYQVINEIHQSGVTIIFITHEISKNLTNGKIIYLDQHLEFIGNYDEYIKWGGHTHD